MNRFKLSPRVKSLLHQSEPYVYLAVGTLVGGATLYPYTLRLQHFKSLSVAYQKNGHEEKVDLSILKMSEEIKEQYKSVLDGHDKVSVFVSSYPDFHHMGSAKSQYGSLIGVPKHYLEKNKDGSSINNFLASLDISASSTEGSVVKQSFHLSENAKRFALAREIIVSKSYQVLFLVLGSQLSISLLYLFSKWAFMLLPFPGVKMLTNCTCLVLYYYGFSAYLGRFCQKKHKNADLTAASLSREIAEAGVEYYDALIARENILKEYKFVKIENKCNFLDAFMFNIWNSSHLSLQERKENVENALEKMFTEESLAASS